MELIAAYNKAHSIDRIHYFTMESIINEVMAQFKGKPMGPNAMMIMKSLLEEHMVNRGLHRYFQVEISYQKGKVHAHVNEINTFHKPKECVIWN